MKHIKSILTILIMSLIQTMLFAQTSDVPNVVPGELSITPSGAATYEVPLELPPGANGIAPDLKLVYNSQAGNGLAGWGWNVSGLSTISRIHSSKFHDGIMDPVDFDELDRFALDGQRLLIKSGTYGANGAVYQTENYSNIKIRSVGVSTYGAEYGPKYFVVHYPDGSRGFYGNANTARGKLEWALFKWQDTNGNFIRYTYARSGEFIRIANVYYGSRGSTASPNRIKFIYKNRAKVEQSYISGQSFIRSKILRRIEISNSNLLYRSYNLGHDKNSLDYERVVTISVKNEDNETKSIRFEYGETSNGISVGGGNNTDLLDIDPSEDTMVSDDFTGDGNMDVLVYDKNSRNNVKVIANISNPLSTSFPSYVTDFDVAKFDAVISGNILSSDGTLIPERGIVTITDSPNSASASTSNVRFNGYTLNSSGETFQYGRTWQAPTYRLDPLTCNDNYTYRTPKVYRSGDFNGDGLLDVLAFTMNHTERWCQETSNCDDNPQPIAAAAPPGDCCECTDYPRANSKSYFIDLNRNKTSNFSNYSGQLGFTLRYASDAKNLVITDYDGDGKSDILWFESGKVTAYSLDNNNILREMFEYTDDDLSVEDKLITTGDFNGDGKLDLATPEAENSSVWNFYIGDGLSFKKFSDDINIEYKKNLENSITVEEYNYATQDLDNDGRSDFLVHHADYSKISNNSREIISVYYGRQFGANLSGITFHAPKVSDEWISGDITKGFPLLTNRRSTHGGLYYYVRQGWSRTVASKNRNDAEMRLKKVNNGLYPGAWGNFAYGSLIQEIEYDQVNLYGNSLFDGASYTPSYDLAYPYVNVNVAFDFMVVKKVTEIASNFRSTRTVRYKDFNYQGAMSHYTGLGFLGFELTAASNWYGDNVPQLWNYTKRSADLRGAVTESYTSEYSQPTVSLAKFHTKYEYTTNLQGNMVFVNVPNKVTAKDELRGTISTKSLTYDTHFLPLTTITDDGSTTTRESYTYYPNRISPNNQNYFVGRTKSKTVAATLDSHTFKTFEEYSYENNRVRTSRMKGDGTPWVTETFSYDGWGNMLTKTLSGTDMADRTEIFTFTSDGRFLKTYTDVEGLTIDYENDVVGNVTKVTDALGNSTGYKFDRWNRLEEQTDYLSKKTKYLYELQWEGGWKVTTDHDNAPDTIALTNAYGWTIATSALSLDDKWINIYYEYDVAGRNNKVSEPSFDGATGWNETIYDEFGRVIEQREHTGKVTQINYSGLAAITNDGTLSTTTEMNASGLVSKKTDEGGTITYQYYGNGTLRETEFGGMKTLLEIDKWGRKTKLTDPSAGVYTYAYNLFGETTREETPKGATDYTYDDFGRLKSRKIIGDQTHLTLDYQYKANGLLERIAGTDVLSAQDYTYTYGYDSYERPNLVKEVNGFASFQKELIYDIYGRPEKETFITKNLSDGTISTVAVRNQYQSSSGAHIKIVNDTNSDSLWQLNTEDPRGHIIKATYGNGFVRNEGYDAYGLPQTVSVSKGSGTSAVNALDMGYSFNANKRRLNSRENKNLSWAESFEYDNLNRLTEVNGPETREHQYDLMGRISSNDLLGNYNYNDTKKYQLAGIDLNEKGGGYYMGRERREITYNAFKQPVEVIEENKGKVSFAYSPLGNRSHAWFGGQQEKRSERRYRKHYSAIMPVEIIEDTELDNVKIITYVGGDAYTAPISHILTKNDDIAGFHYLHRDYQGSILAITDTEGNIKEQRQFGAWGTVDMFVSASPNTSEFGHDSLLDRGYTGHEHFFEVALIHMNGRMYDAQLGRFLSPDSYVQDPYNTQNFNRYGYVLNNPLLYSDPSGERFEGFGGPSPWGLVYLFARLLGFAAPDLFGGGFDNANNWGSIETAPTPNGKIQGPIPSNATSDGGLEGAWSDALKMPTGQYDLGPNPFESNQILSGFPGPITSSSKNKSLNNYPNYQNEEGWNPWTAAWATTGILLADDVTGIGVVDDFAIPIVLAGALTYDITKRTFITYTMTNAAGQVYAGRSSGFEDPYTIMNKRASRHHMRAFGFGNPILDRAVQGLSGYPAIRGREQQLIDYYGGVDNPKVGNRIRGVSKYNPFGYIYHDASDLYFGPKAPYTGLKF